MDCDYCGLATGEVARWEVATGVWPGDGKTRYVCHNHRRAAERLMGQVGEVRVVPINSAYVRSAA